MVVEKRVETSPVYTFKRRSHPALPWQSGTWSLNTFEGEMASSNHAPINTEADDGGPWLMSKTETHVSPGFLNNPDRFVGNFTVGGYRYGYTYTDAQPHDSDAQMIGFGSTAIARSAPNNPHVDLATAIGELRNEGLPSLVGASLWKSQTRKAQSAGSEYLNYEFGWRPLVTELRKLAVAVRDSEQLWADFVEGSGRKTRVGYSYEPEYTQGSITGEMIPIPSYVPGFLRGGLTETVRSQRWFKGCFKYYVPTPSSDFGEKMSYWSQQAGYLYGLRLTPDVVWNLQPWSWATDWFVNTGDLMSNISNLGSDGLVMQYGYAMHESIAERHFYGAISGAFSDRRLIIKRAKRIQASPYGFGVTLATLTNRQLAIIAALGLGRS